MNNFNKYKTNMMSKVYRYKLDPQIIELVEQFAKLHQYDERKEYKEAWLEYIEKQKDQIERETLS